MNDFLVVLLIAAVAGFLTYLGAPAAERFDVPHRIVSAALQFAAGIIAAIVGFSLMPSAVTAGPPLAVVLAFFVGGALFVFLYIIRRGEWPLNLRVKPMQHRLACISEF